jgi:phosphatidylglycerophosphate synthase
MIVVDVAENAFCRVPPGCTIVLRLGSGCQYLFLPSESTGVICAHRRSRYQTLDNVDGKQARRTGTSSGLGELFEYVEQLK